MLNHYYKAFYTDFGLPIIFRGCLQEKGLREAELLTSKAKLANACMSNQIILFLNCYYILATHKNLLY